MTTPTDEPVCQRLMTALSDIVDSLEEERTLFASFMELLLKHEWTIRERGGDQAVDALKEDLGGYIDFVEKTAVEARDHIDSVLDGASVGDLCERMDAFSSRLTQRREMQKRVGEGVTVHLKGLPNWSEPESPEQ